MTSSAHPRRRGTSQRFADDQDNTNYVFEQIVLTDEDEDEDGDFTAPGPSNGKRKRQVPPPVASQPTQPTQKPPKTPKVTVHKAPAAKQARRPVNGSEQSQDGRGQPPLEFPQDQLRKISVQLNKYKAEYEARDTATPLDLPQQELVHLAGKAARYMLFAHLEKPGVPVPRAKVCDAITTDYKDHKAVRKLPQVVIPLAQELMLSSMGLDMREVERPAANSKKEDAAGGKFYVLRSVLPAGVRQAIMPGLQARRGPPGFTLTVLALVQLSGGQMHEEALWEWLGKLGVTKDDDHPTLGKIPEQLHHMEQCRYIIRVKRSTAAGGDQGSGIAYEWGECAHEEVGAEAVKAFITKEFASQAHAAGGAQAWQQTQNTQRQGGGRGGGGGGGGGGTQQRGPVEVVELLDSDE